MKSLLSPLKRIIFLNFILFAVFAGQESGCGNESNITSSNSGQGNSGKGQFSSSHQGSKMSYPANPRKGSRFTKMSIQDLIFEFFGTQGVSKELINWVENRCNGANLPLPKNTSQNNKDREHLIKIIIARMVKDIQEHKSLNLVNYSKIFLTLCQALKDDEYDCILKESKNNDLKDLIKEAVKVINIMRDTRSNEKRDQIIHG